MVIVSLPSHPRSRGQWLKVDDQHTVAGTAMALGSHFSPVPYSLFKAWSLAPKPPLHRHWCHSGAGNVNQLRHRIAPARHIVLKKKFSTHSGYLCQRCNSLSKQEKAPSEPGIPNRNRVGNSLYLRLQIRFSAKKLCNECASV